MPHWKTLTNPKFIGAYEFKPREERTVTIRTVMQQEVAGEGGRKSQCAVAVLEGGEKPMILNATNLKSIARLHGNDYENWSGKQVTLYESTTNMAGEMVACLRIRPTVVVKKQAITDARLEKAMASIEAGTFTLDDLLGKFELTQEQIAKLPVTEEVAQ